MLAFESLTPEALLKEVAAYIRQQAARAQADADRTSNLSKRKLESARANVLTLIAMDLEGAGVLPPNSPFRRTPAEATPAPTAYDAEFSARLSDFTLRKSIEEYEAQGAMTEGQRGLYEAMKRERDKRTPAPKGWDVIETAPGPEPLTLTEAQQSVIVQLRAMGCEMVAHCTEEHWKKGEAYYIDDRVPVSKRLRRAFEQANPDPPDPEVLESIGKIVQSVENDGRYARNKHKPRPNENNDCSGSGPHTPGEVRVMPTGGGGNMIFCRACWEHELQYRRDRNKSVLHPVADPWELPAWESAKVYEAS